MEASQFLARRRADARFQNERRVTGVSGPTMASFDAPKQWFDQPARGLKRTTETFAMEKSAEESPKKSAKKRKKGEGTDSSSSSSEDKGGKKKKKTTKPKVGNAPGYDGPNRCWDGKKRDYSKLRGEKGSCVPKED